MKLMMVMEMWLRLLGPLDEDSERSLPVTHADFCHCPTCRPHAAIVFNGK